MRPLGPGFILLAARLRIFHIDRLLLTMRCDVHDTRSDPAKRHFVPIGEEGYG